MSDTSGSGFGKFVPGFEFLQNLAGQAAGGVAQGLGKSIPQMPNLGNWVAPTFNVEDLEKRIEELKAVHFWLDQNSKALAATIQALEVQKMTLATLKNMNFSLGDVANALKIKAADTVASFTGGAPTAAPVHTQFAGLEIPPRTYGTPTPPAASDDDAEAEEDEDEIDEDIRQRLSNIPGVQIVLSQPISERVDEMVTGVRSQVAIKVFGDELGELRRVSEDVARLLKSVEGSRDIRIERLSGQQALTVDIDRKAIARHGINVILTSSEKTGLAPAIAIENRLSDSSIDLLVMGAYGNKRWWEMLFGGVTRTLLDSMTALTLLSR